VTSSELGLTGKNEVRGTEKDIGTKGKELDKGNRKHGCLPRRNEKSRKDSKENQNRLDLNTGPGFDNERKGKAGEQKQKKKVKRYCKSQGEKKTNKPPRWPPKNKGRNS